MCVSTTVNNAREKGIMISNLGSFKGVSGHGLEARYADHAILIGNRKLMDDKTAILAAIYNRLAGIIWTCRSYKRKYKASNPMAMYLTGALFRF